VKKEIENLKAALQHISVCSNGNCKNVSDAAKALLDAIERARVWYIAETTGEYDEAWRDDPCQGKVFPATVSFVAIEMDTLFYDEEAGE
jgi:hypothetical protein